MSTIKKRMSDTTWEDWVEQHYKDNPDEFKDLHPEFVSEFQALKGKQLTPLSCRTQDGYNRFEIVVENKRLCFDIAEPSAKCGMCFTGDLESEYE